MARKKDEVMLIDEQELMEEQLSEVIEEDGGIELELPEEINEEPTGDSVIDELLQETCMTEIPQQEGKLLEEEAQSDSITDIQPSPLLLNAEVAEDNAKPEQAEMEIETGIDASESPEPARPRRRTRRNTNQVLSIDDNTQVRSAEEEENQLWLELRNAQRGRRILSGTLSGIERLENGLPMAIVYYKNNIRVAIPATEMMIQIANQEEQSELVIYNRYAQLLSRMLATEIDFMIAGLDRRNGVVLGSRKQAMERKQQRYYLNSDADGQYLINEGQIVEARVVVVSDKQIRLEVFGVETNVITREIAWEWIDDVHNYYQVGDRVLVKIKEIQREEPDRLRIAVSIREATENPSAANLKKCSVNGKYIGTVTGIDNVVYVRLNIGVNAIATTVRDSRAVCSKDEVSFVVTRIDEANGLAVGIITRIIKQAN